MKKLQNDIKKLTVLNDIMDDVKKEIEKSISIGDKFIPINVDEKGIYTDANGFIGFIDALNPKWIKKYKSGNINVFEFYNNDVKIWANLYDEESKKLEAELLKLKDIAYNNTIIMEVY